MAIKAVHNLITLQSVVNTAIPLTDEGKHAYFWLRRQWAKPHLAPSHPMDYPMLDCCSSADRIILDKAYKRARAKYQAVISERKLNRRKYVYLLIIEALRRRRHWRNVLRSRGEKITDLYAAASSTFGISYIAEAPRRTALQEIGTWLKTDEKSHLTDMAWSANRKRMISDTFWARQRLYACAGELEARSLRTLWRGGDRFASTRRVTNYRAAFWDVGRDGGGQPEIRFAIQHKLPDLACKLVSRIGSIEANGGHIHTNCQYDEDTARRVYYGLRYHLSWFRYLAPMTRRRSRWSSVNAVHDFDTGLRTKFAAVSASQFSRIGTVEVRLWPTTARADDWRFRAQLMQSIGRWTEIGDHLPLSDWRDNAGQPWTYDGPINNATSTIAWEAYYNWAAEHDPDALKAILKAMRAKVRTLTRPPRSRNARSLFDRFGALRCDLFVRQFDESGVRLRGYRRTALPAVPALSPSQGYCEADDE